MTNKERIYNCIAGKEIDNIPSSFSKHFPADFAYGKIGVENHIRFFKESQVDIVKIMNEYQMPFIGKIEKPEDWLKVTQLSKDDHFIYLLIDFVKELMEEMGEDEYYLLTVHGIIACTIHISLRQLGFYDARSVHAAHCRENPVVMGKVHEHIVLLIKEIISQAKEIGVDGIYYSSLGGDNIYLTDDEFARMIMPYEKEVLSFAKSCGLHVFLHMCKGDLVLERYAPYAEFADVVNWAIEDNQISLSQGEKIFPGKTIMGGLGNRDGDLINGNKEKVQEKVKKIYAELGRDTQFILGADCTMPTEIENRHLSYVKNV